MKNEDLLENYVIKWKEKLKIEIDCTDLKKFISNITRITISTKLRSFQYRLLLHALITNVQLYWYKIKQNSNCTQCNKTPETIVHMFYECEYTQKLLSFVYKEYKIRKLKIEEIIFNTITENPKLVKKCNNPANKNIYIYKTLFK